jgi:membrane fusion protein (multidrug efflux system)
MIVHPRFELRGARRALRCGLILAATAVLTACTDSPKDAGKDAAKGAPPPAMPVTVQKVEPQRIAIAIQAVGQSEGSREVEIRARISGLLEKRLYAEGTMVKAGQTLFTIDRAPYQIAVEQARAALLQERARNELLVSESNRLKPLVEGRAISQREYDEAVSAVKQSDATMAGAKARLTEAELNLSYTSVTAPISGITNRALRSEGSLVPANTDLLTTLTQVDPIWVRFSMAEADFERVRSQWKTAQVRIESQNGTLSAKGGRINFTGSTVDGQLGTVQLRAEFSNRDLTWLPGQFVKVYIEAGEQEAFLVPQVAVMQTEQGRMVWIAQSDGSVAPRPIKTANWIGSHWIVTEGLKAGDHVIVDNLIKLRPGARVAPQTGTAAPQPAAAGGASAPAAKSGG